MSHASIIKQLRTARLRGVPLVAINTPDPNATIRAVCEGVNGESAKIAWDVARGMIGLNDAGRAAVADGGDSDSTQNNPAGGRLLDGIEHNEFPSVAL